MARRKEFKTVADGLISSFVSRNNDVYGYWGIGKLYSHMLSSGSMKLTIDLIDRIMEPNNEEFAILISEYSERLRSQIKSRGINDKFLKNAVLTLVGYPNEPSPYLGKMAPNRVHCKLLITDDLAKDHSSEANSWCREHNPDNDSKSNREY
jgi:hypothetical protein